MPERKGLAPPLTVKQLNGLPREQSKAFFIDCCHCVQWAENMLEARPFENVSAVVNAAADFWDLASDAMILEAFNGHALIGDRAAIKIKYSAAAKEQGQINDANDDTLTAIGQENKAYFEAYGFIFVVCATGKSAEEMLELLRQRMGNSREQELQAGGSEQGKITQLRLQQRLSDA